MGRDRKRRRGGAEAGVVFILLGVFLLLANLGYLSPEAVETAARFWPVLLILAGLSLLSGGGRAGALVVVVAALAGFALVSLVWHVAGRP